MDTTRPPEWMLPFTHPKKLPYGFRSVEWRLDGAAFLGPGHCSVVISGDIRDDGKRWLHASIARRDYIPTWSDLQMLRTYWIGEKLYCCMIFPPEDKYVRIHPHALHLYCCLDSWPIPEMSGVINGLRTI